MSIFGVENHIRLPRVCVTSSRVRGCCSLSFISERSARLDSGSCFGTHPHVR
jgi:hypothetical protein